MQGKGIEDVVFLHGFGVKTQEDILKNPVAARLKDELRAQGINFHALHYHPDGVQETDIARTLTDLSSLASLSAHGRICLVGYSFGGLLAALFQSYNPLAVGRACLIAPAIDNFERNFKDVKPESWYMSSTYVDQLSKLPARPAIRVPTVVIHGQRDDDSGGSAPWRIVDWLSGEPNLSIWQYFPDHDHFLTEEIFQAHGGMPWDDFMRWVTSGSSRLCLQNPLGAGTVTISSVYTRGLLHCGHATGARMVSAEVAASSTGSHLKFYQNWHIMAAGGQDDGLVCIVSQHAKGHLRVELTAGVAESCGVFVCDACEGMEVSNAEWRLHAMEDGSHEIEMPHMKSYLAVTAGNRLSVCDVTSVAGNRNRLRFVLSSESALVFQ